MRKLLILFLLVFLGCRGTNKANDLDVSPYSLYRYDGVRVFEYGDLIQTSQGFECDFKYNAFDHCVDHRTSLSPLFPEGKLSFGRDSTISIRVGVEAAEKDYLIAKFANIEKGNIIFQDNKRSIEYMDEGNVRGFLAFPVHVHYYKVEDEAVGTFIYAISLKYGFMGIHKLIKHGSSYSTERTFGLWYKEHSQEIQEHHDERNF